MAWSISISNEGWNEIHEACHAKSKIWLFKAVNEARRQNHDESIRWKKFKSISKETLADEVYHIIARTNTCDNGGFKFWVDPAGYFKIEIDE